MPRRTSRTSSSSSTTRIEAIAMARILNESRGRRQVQAVGNSPRRFQSLRTTFPFCHFPDSSGTPGCGILPASTMNILNRHSHIRRRSLYAAVGIFAVAGLLAGVHGAQSNSSAIALKHDDQPVARGQFEPASFSAVVKRVAPSVVKITTETRGRRIAMNSGEAPFFNDPTFRQFFGGRAPEMREGPQAALGSGVIISADGYIATNNHVVDGADKVTVTLED